MTIAQEPSICPPSSLGSSPSVAAMPLLAMSATGRLEGLLLEMTIEQSFANRSERTLEAIFTFAIPLNAVLLGLELELGERRLKATVASRPEATERYEQAIDGGDTAVLLESQANGLWTVSVGNLLPGELAVIRYQHAELLAAYRGQVRIQIPTAIAPRYDEVDVLSLVSPIKPEIQLLAQYPFNVSLSLVGLKDTAAICSPSHSILVNPEAEGLRVGLTRGAMMDRDFVLEVLAANVPTNAVLALDARGAGWVAMTSVVLESEPDEQRALALKVLIDCSGSMAGDSINAAKRAVMRALDLLDERDRLALLLFGTRVQRMTNGIEVCTAQRISILRQQLLGVDANLGGTEMQAAIQAAVDMEVPDETNAGTHAVRDILLITDGEISAIDQLVDLVAESGHRLFVVAVGAAPVEALARRLAQATGGACAFVAAGELVEGAILQMFSRLRAQPRVLSTIEWSRTPAWVVSPPKAVFAGETVHLLAGFDKAPEGQVHCVIESREGVRINLHSAISTRVQRDDVLARVAAARRIVEMDPEDQNRAVAMAVQYQLATAHTSFVLVAERAEDEKANGLPSTVAVPHMLSAGWGGSSRVEAASMSVVMLQERSVPNFCASQEMPMFCRRSVEAHAEHDGQDMDLMTCAINTEMAAVPARYFDRQQLCENILAAASGGGDCPESWADLEGLQVPEEVIELLKQIGIDHSVGEKKIVQTFIALCLREGAKSHPQVNEVMQRWGLKESVWGHVRNRALRSAIRQRLFTVA